MKFTIAIITARKRSLGQADIFRSICLSTLRVVVGGGVMMSLSVMDSIPLWTAPPGRHHPLLDSTTSTLDSTTPGQHSPAGQHPLENTLSQQAGGTHSTGMLSCLAVIITCNPSQINCLQKCFYGKYDSCK